jgi:MoxR-like ATPase
MFAWGHALIEWVPGLGKTKTVKTIAKVFWYETKRISFTPDLLPTDLTWVEIYRPQTAKFEVRKWPIFTNILLADEINRTPPKVQSALLEAMEEHQVTIGNETFTLPSPFFVIATQNPLEHEWTYPLPEAELDRFFMKILLSYPLAEDEKKIFSQNPEDEKKWNDTPLLTKEEFLELKDYIKKKIYVDANIYQYISSILEATRLRKSPPWDTSTNKNPELSDITRLLSYGASTRAWIAMVEASRIIALLDNRDYVSPDDIKYIAHEILRHRIGLSYEAISEWISSDDIITDILNKVIIP